MPVLRYRLRSRAAPSMARISRAQLLTTRVVAYAGAYSVVGADADLSISNDTILTAEAGALSLSGQSASVLLSRVLAAGAGGFSLSGQSADLGITLTLEADVGSYALGGQDGSLIVSRVVVGAAGSFDLTGTDASFLLGKYISAGAGSIDLTGQTASLLLSQVLAAGAGSIDLSGVDAALGRQLPLSADAGDFNLTGQSALLYRSTAIDSLAALGLTTDLKLCLDAGDADSYTSGQSWLDRAGSGYDFFLGTDGSANSEDPTFTGTAGDRDAYFATDGSDYFTYDSSNETWMEDMHKAGAAFTIMQWVYLASNNTVGFWGTARANVNDVGVVFRTGSSGNTTIQIPKGSGGLALGNGSGPVVPTGQWALVGMSLDSSDGSTGIRHFVNGSTVTASGTLTSPSAAAASYVAKIGAVGDGGALFQSGSRLAVAMVWQGTALSIADMDRVYQAQRGWFGI